MPIDASKPAPLRLWGFLLTVGGGVLVAFGALQVWVTATVSGQSNPISPTWPGVDLPEGLVALVCGIVLIVGILVLRGVPGRAKRVVAVILIVAGVLAFALAGEIAATASNRFADPQLVAEQVSAAKGVSIDAALALVGNKFTVALGIGVILAALGGILGAIGGVLSLALVTRPAAGTDAAEDDPLPASD